MYANRLIRPFLVLSIFLMTVQSLCSQAINIQVQPGVSIPILGSESIYSLGWTVDAGVDYHLPFAPFLVLNGSLGYTSSSVPSTSQALALISAGAGGGINATLADRLHLRLVGDLGYYEGIYNSLYGGSLYYSLGGGATFALFPFLSLGVAGAYSDYTSSPGSLYRGLKAWLDVTISPVAEKPVPKLEIPEPGIKLMPLFPVFYKFFDTNPLGTVTIRNQETGPISNVTLSFFIKEYMDGPKVCGRIDSMKPGEPKQLNVYALLKDSVLNITEDTKVTAAIDVSYVYNKYNLDVEKTESLRIYNRNAMTWEDNRRAASFVASKDPMVMKFSKAVNAAVRDDPTPAANLNFRIAMAMFQALDLYGVRYTVNPKGSYAEFSVNKYTVDYLQFPRQTLTYKGGDCSDISILYGSLLESLGMETAFITVPGHIFLAFAPGIDPADAKNVFSNIDDLIIRDGELWIPVEITMVTDGFLKAWQEGAREWRENTDSRNFYPMHESWKVYEPVGMTGTEESLPDMATAPFQRTYSTQLAAFINREVAAREVPIKNEIAKTNSSPASVNKLGALYARFGLMEKAEAQFQLAAGSGTYLPALLNLGNLSFLKKDWQNAFTYYDRARQIDSRNPSVLISLARVDYERENYGSAKASYLQAIALNPDLTDRYSYLGQKSDETTRAAAADTRSTVQWFEE